jgi:amidophosphoribosyltransferase
VDTPTEEELIASRKSIAEIEDFIGVDTLAYLSLEGLLNATNDPSGSRFCTACYTKKYPVPIPRDDSEQLKLFHKEAKEVEPRNTPAEAVAARS